MRAYKEGIGMKKDSDSTRLALLEQSIGYIGETLLRLDKRFDSIDSRFDSVDHRFDKVETKIEKLDSKIEETRRQAWSKFRWVMGTIAGLFVTVILKGHGG